METIDIAEGPIRFPPHLPLVNVGRIAVVAAHVAPAELRHFLAFVELSCFSIAHIQPEAVAQESLLVFGVDRKRINAFARHHLTEWRSAGPPTAKPRLVSAPLHLLEHPL